MQIVMIGTGYVGLVTGTCFAEIGHNVVCVDTNEHKINRLRDGISPIYEPGLEDMIERNASHGRLGFTVNLGEALKDAEVAFIAVGTPEGEDGSADMGYVKSAAQAIGRLADHDFLVVVKSTVPVGSCDMVAATIQEELVKRGVQDQITVTVASNPEFLKEGDAIKDFMRPDRIVTGVSNDGDAEIFRKIYKPFYMDDPSKLLTMDRRSSELTKYGANSMLATRISFMNELSQLCEQLGADIDAVRRGMGSDTRIGKKFLYAGPGYGGSCFPKDVLALLKMGEKNEVPFTVLQAVSDVNDRQKQWAGEKVSSYFKGDLQGRVVAVWGLAFKPGTDDVREAPAKSILAHLLARGATIQAHDPQAMETFAEWFGADDRVCYIPDAYDALKGADAMVLVTEWSEYRRPDWDKISTLLKEKVVFDLRNQYEPGYLMDRGFHYQCIGRPDSASGAGLH